MNLIDWNDRKENSFVETQHAQTWCQTQKRDNENCFRRQAVSCEKRIREREND